MSFLSEWHAKIDSSLADFAGLAVNAGDITQTYAVVGAAVLWPIRKSLQQREDEAVDTLIDLIPSGYRTIRKAVDSWSNDRFLAARSLADRAQDDRQLQKSLESLVKEFDAMSIFTQHLAQALVDQQGSGNVYNVEEEINAAIVNLGGKVSIQSLILTLPGTSTIEGIGQSQRDERLNTYRQRILENTDFVELYGIPTPVNRSGQATRARVPLDTVYIRLQATAKEEQRFREEAEEQEVVKQTRKRVGDDGHQQPKAKLLGTLRILGEHFYRRGQVYKKEERPVPIDPNVALSQYGRLVILGAPGSGKTTLLRYLARSAARNREERIPLLIKLRDFGTRLSQDNTAALQDFALRQISEGDMVLEALLRDIVEQGRAIWLLDALDEAGPWAERVAEQASRLPGPMILTSRPVGYVTNAQLLLLPHFEVLPLQLDEIVQFVHDWYKLEVKTSEKELPIGDMWVKERVAHFLAYLEERPRLQPLIRNPLMLTFLVALVSRESKFELPTQRAALYRLFVEKLLNQWETQRAGSNAEFSMGPLIGEEARECALQGFNYLGWYLHLTYYGGRREHPPNREIVVDALAKTYEARDHRSSRSIAKAVLDFWLTAGLLEVWTLDGQEYLLFRHLTFQEFAVARVIAERWTQNANSTWSLMQPRLHHFAWREPILLLAGLLDNVQLNDLVRRLLKGKSSLERSLHRDLRLAATLISEGTPVEEQLAQRITKRVGWLSRSHRKSRILLVLAIYGAFILMVMALLFSFNLLVALVASGVSTLAFFFSFVKPVLPRLQGVLSLPLRLAGFSPIEETMVTLAAQLGEQAVPELLISSKDSDSDVRASALFALSHFDDASVVPQLSRALIDKDINVRLSAIAGLGKVGTAEAAEALIVALQDRTPIVRQASALALANMGKPAINELVETILNEREPGIRRVAALMLAQNANNDIAFTFVEILTNENIEHLASRIRIVYAIEALGYLGNKTALKPLIDTLVLSRYNHSEIRLASAKALGNLGHSEAVPSLIDALSNPRTDLRIHISDSLGQIGDTATIPALSSLLDESDMDLRRSAAESLGKVGDPLTIEILIPYLQDISWQMRKSVADALGMIGHPSAIPFLRKSLKDRESLVRLAVTRALGRIDSKEANSLLMEAYKDITLRVRRAAVISMGNKGKKMIPTILVALQDPDQQIRQAASQTLIGLGATAAEEIMKEFDTLTQNARLDALIILGEIGNKSSIPTVIDALLDSEWRVRMIAARILGQIGDESVENCLKKALKDQQAEVRATAALSLGEVGCEGCADDLIFRLNDSSPSVRIASAKALGTITPKLHDRRVLKAAKQNLWWRLTDIEPVSNVAGNTLDQLMEQLTALEVEDLPIQDLTLMSI